MGRWRPSWETLGGDDILARSINEAGQVVGDFTTAEGFTHAFITGPNGVGMTDLGTLGGRTSHADSINAAGQVVGYSSTADGVTHAFITGPNGMGMTDIGTLVKNGQSFAEGVNAAGQVVGWTTSKSTDGITAFDHAFITGPNGAGMTELDMRGSNHSSVAFDINTSGRVVGNFDNMFRETRAFITGPDGLGMIDLGTLSASEFLSSYATGINDVGEVVGSSEIGGTAAHAFITGVDGVGMTDLNSLVNMPDGVILAGAADINNSGQVIAIAVTPIPEPASYALMLAGLGLAGFMARRKKLEK